MKLDEAIEDITLLKSCIKRLKHFSKYPGLDIDAKSSLDAWIKEIEFRCDAHLTAGDDPWLLEKGIDSSTQRIMDYKNLMREHVILAFKTMEFIDNNQIVDGGKCVYKKQLDAVLKILSSEIDYGKLHSD